MQERPTLSDYRIKRAEELIADAEKLFEKGSNKSANNARFLGMMLLHRVTVLIFFLDYDTACEMLGGGQ